MCVLICHVIHFLQMKDRTADGGTPTPEQLQAEKVALKQENILVVLGSLHALLKGLWVGTGTGR